MLTLDPEVRAVLEKLPRPASLPAVGDIATRRTNIEGLFVLIAANLGAHPEVPTRDFEAASADGTKLRLRWFGASTGSAIVYLHGGGMIMGTLEGYDAILRAYVAETGVPLLAVDYRVAPEFPFPKPVEDCFAGVAWLFEHAQELGVDPARIAVMGDSAGGGLAAATAIVARDRGLKLAHQILIYPMLDPTNRTPDLALAPFAVWSWDDNITGWDAFLPAGKGWGPADADLAGVAPAFIDCGQLDIFCAEDIAYAHRLAKANVTTELHIRPGCPHGFDALAPRSGVGSRSYADRHRVMRSI